MCEALKAEAWGMQHSDWADRRCAPDPPPGPPHTHILLCLKSITAITAAQHLRSEAVLSAQMRALLLRVG